MKSNSTKKMEQRPIQPNENPVCTLKPGERLRAGLLCPRCHEEKIEYNGLLNLVCPKCGLTEVGAST